MRQILGRFRQCRPLSRAQVADESKGLPSEHALGCCELFAAFTLDQQQIRLIAGIQLGMLRKRLGNVGLDMEITDEALGLLAEAGFDPVYGARPLKRAIQQQIENPLAQSILSGDFVSGDTVNIAVEDGQFRFTR